MGGTYSSEEIQAQADGQKNVQIVAKPSALVVCGPSGVGKGTLIKKLMDGSPRLFGFSCSHTTRAPRQGEEDGMHYNFTTKEDFEKGIEAGRFLEYARVHSNIYGTAYKAVEAVSEAGKCCILDIDMQGARQVRKSKLKAIFVFVAPPSTEALEQRLCGRNTETSEQIDERMAAAREEIATIKEPGLYDYVIFNDDLEDAFAQLVLVAKRALSGKQGNGSQSITGPVTLVAEEEPSQASEPAAAAAVAPANASAQAAGEQSEETPLLTESVEPAQQPATSKAVEASATNQEALTAAPAGTDTSSASTQPSSAPQQGPASQQSGMERWRGKVALVTGESAGIGVASAVQGVAAGWRGKVALVTGASAGIGWSVCELLAQAGMRVVAIARRRERLEALQQQLVSQGIPIADFLPVVCDITKEAEVVALPRIIVKRWPGAGIDVMVNNAGLGRNNAALWDGSTASWVEMISTNVLGVCMCTREALKDMTRREQYGHIINISSMSAHRVPNGSSGGTFYAATKHALRAITEGLRQEARGRKVGLRVSSISPGIVETEFATVHSFGKDEAKDKYKQMKALEAVDVAQAVVYCLSAPNHVDTNDILMRPVEQQT